MMARDVRFEPVTPENIGRYSVFDGMFGELSSYQSRIYPVNREEYISLRNCGLLCWDYIISDGVTAGAVWLEKASPEDRFAVLGIFLADATLRGKGLGRRAICAYISRNAEKLNIDRVVLNVRKANSRAVRCYLACGFTVTGEYVTQKGIPAMKMEKKLCSEVELCL